MVWTRGKGCRELAQVLSQTAVRVSGDLVEACVSHRADLIVARRMPSSRLVSVAVPRDFDAGRVASVVAAVGGGPHSSLAARVAGSLAVALEVPGTLVSASRGPEDRSRASLALRSAERAAPGLESRVVQADRAAELLSDIPQGALLVLGAAGGSLLRRLFLGPGARLVAGASAGAVTVRSAPVRAFSRMGEPEGISPHLLATDARRILQEPVAPVVADGRLIGVVRSSALASGSDGSTVGDLMETAGSVSAEATLDEAAAVLEEMEGGPVAVLDRRGRLVGSIRSTDL